MSIYQSIQFKILFIMLLSIFSANAQIQDTLEIPQQSDWADQGIVLSNGLPGSWDVRLSGMISPCTVIKKDSTYFVYYIGADGNRADGGPAHRKLGVATSTDGISFVKYSGNPIITWNPNGYSADEEGVFSAAAILDSNDNVILYYGAMTGPGSSVHADVRIAISSDGYNFTDNGIVLDHDDGNVWNSGDELYPLGVFFNNGTWYLYYTSDDWELGLAQGSSPGVLPTTNPVIDSGDDIIGGGDPMWIEQNKIGIFIVRDFASNYIEALTANANMPGIVSLKETYFFGGHRHMTIFYDPEIRRWFMFHRQTGGNNVRLRTIQLPDETPPSPPTGLDAQPVSNTQIVLSWNESVDPESGISFYKIYRDTNFIEQSNVTSYSDTGLSDGTTYIYEVSAVNGYGLESPKSSPDTATTFMDNTAPSIPTNLIATPAGNFEIDLNWSESIDPESGISFYKIYRDTLFIDQSVVTSYSDSGLISGETYIYEVSAVNGVGLESQKSLPDSVTTFSDTTPPPAPTGLNATASSYSQVDLNWNIAFDPESGISYYKVYRDNNFSAQSMDTSFIDTGLTFNTTYTYEISAVNGAGLESQRSAPDTATTFTDLTPPEMPSGLNAITISSFQIDLHWNESNDPESGILYYNIYRDFNLLTQTVGTSYSDTGLTYNTTYIYEISAVNGAGLESQRSAPDSATTFSDISPPSIPTNLNANAISISQIDLNWNESNDPESGISYYKIFRDNNFVNQSTITSYSDTGLTYNTTYIYEISAVNGAGLESQRSAPDSATTFSDTSPPSAPTGLDAISMSSSQIDLSWTESSDPESGIDYYKIYRDNNFIEQSINTTYNDTGLTPNTIYVYQVSAVNGAGLESQKSNPDTATTQPTAVHNLQVQIPNTFKLYQNQPNPFNPSTIIKYQIPQSGRIILVIYNILGEKIRILVDKHLQAGVYTEKWNGLDEMGNSVVSGIYFYQLIFLGKTSFTDNKKMLFLK